MVDGPQNMEISLLHLLSQSFPVDRGIVRCFITGATVRGSAIIFISQTRKRRLREENALIGREREFKSRSFVQGSVHSLKTSIY